MSQYGVDSRYIKISPERQYLSLDGVGMTNDKKALKDYNLTDFSTVTLTDMGMTMPMWLAKVIVYAGVPIIYELYVSNHF